MPFTDEFFRSTLKKIKNEAPLVHCLTNEVVSNFTANVLLAIGAVPTMVVAEEEAASFAELASSLLVNVGTLTAQQACAMGQAVQVMHRQQKPWVLDPVAFGAVQYRSDFCLELLQYSPTVIRGNPAEIAALNTALGGAPIKIESKGPDSLLSSTEVLAAGQELAKNQKCVVALTGETDYVTDGIKTNALNNGHIMMTKVTGTGCSLGGMVAAYLAVVDDPMQAAACALSHMALAGELAFEQVEKEKGYCGTGHFAVELLDQLYLLHDCTTVSARLKARVF